MPIAMIQKTDLLCEKGLVKLFRTDSIARSKFAGSTTILEIVLFII